MAVTADTAFVAQGPTDRLAQRDADILDGVMGVDVQIALRFDAQIDQSMTRDLVEHVIEKRKTAGELGVSGAIQIDVRLNSGLQGIALNRCDACRHAN